jgi:hypothetical protein
MSDDEAGVALLKAYRGACDSYDPDQGHGNHPSHDVNRWIKIAATGGMNSEKQIEKGEDDEQPELSAGGNNGNGNGPTPTQDGSFSIGSDSVARFTTAAGKVLLGNDALVARASQSNPTRAANMASRIANYGRLK